MELVHMGIKAKGVPKSFFASKLAPVSDQPKKPPAPKPQASKLDVAKFEKYVTKYNRYKDDKSKVALLKKVVTKGKQYAAKLKKTETIATVPNLKFFDGL